MFDTLLLQHCSPTLAGLKTGNLFSCKACCQKDINQCIANWNGVLNEKGIYLSLLKYESGNALIYLYRPKKLAHDLLDNAKSEFLSKHGYDCHCLDKCLDTLRKRVKAKQFPHEIGIFLGYPLDDIQSFIQNKGKNFKLCGCWKVYHNTTEAQRLFALYDKCTKIYCEKFSLGKAITQLAVAGK